MRSRSTARRGFVLLAVLWIVTALAVLGATLTVAGNDGVRATQNRIWLEQARWRAEGCVARVRALLDDALARDTIGTRGGLSVWSSADRLIQNATLPHLIGCDVAMRATGSGLDLNTADADDIGAVLRAAGVPGADSLAAALLDWRDQDDVPREHGAEAAWYHERHRLFPRNGALTDVRELRRVKGFEALDGLDSLFTVDGGRIPVNHTPPAVLAALPGFTAEAVARMREHRARRDPVRDLVAFAGELSPNARSEFIARYAELAPLVTIEPEGWIVTACRHEGNPSVTMAVEVVLARAAHGTTVTRQRSWAE